MLVMMKDNGRTVRQETNREKTCGAIILKVLRLHFQPVNCHHFSQYGNLGYGDLRGGTQN